MYTIVCIHIYVHTDMHIEKMQQCSWLKKVFFAVGVWSMLLKIEMRTQKQHTVFVEDRWRGSLPS